jgi:hypothetical protein
MAVGDACRIATTTTDPKSCNNHLVVASCCCLFCFTRVHIEVADDDGCHPSVSQQYGLFIYHLDSRLAQPGAPDRQAVLQIPDVAVAFHLQNRRFYIATREP